MIGLWTAVALAGGQGGGGGKQGWSEPRPYVLPVLNLGIVSSGGTTEALASAGVVGGARLKYSGHPDLLSNTRASLVGSYGILYGQLGADLRVGSFIGPDTRFITWQVGPDFFYNGFGREGEFPYWLPWSPGIELHDVLTIKIVRELHLVGEATPGFPFDGDRLGGGLGPFPELTLAGMVVVTTSHFGLTVGYSRRYASFGTGEKGQYYDSIILSGAL